MIRLMNGEKITIETLGRMVQKGFDETAKREEVNNKFDGVNNRFDKLDERLDRIEHLLIADHQQRIEKLEVEMKELRGMLAMK